MAASHLLCDVEEAPRDEVKMLNILIKCLLCLTLLCRMCKFQMAVYMLQLSRTEMLSTVLCSKFRGASFTFFQFLHYKCKNP